MAKIDWTMELGFTVGYCLTHERSFPILAKKYPAKCAEAVYVHPLLEDEGYSSCYGPFVFNDPPAPLTEEEWETILDSVQEGSL